MNEYADLWRGILRPDRTTWVVFEQGTCVVLTKPDEDLGAQAIAILKDWPEGHGSYLGDFTVSKQDNDRGWLVTCGHSAILNYVARSELKTVNPHDVEIGISGRARRGQDATELRVVHVEDRRGL